MEKAKKVCQHCNTPVSGRADKRFCSDQCRAIAGNSRKMEDKGEVLMKQVNQILRRNRNILKQASPQGKTTLRREVLEQAGFQFSYFTTQFRTNRGNTYNFCYDYGYLLLPEEKVLIVKQQSYMAG
jgi:predicted nucleic acid-binding Zn ribbon protein